MGIFLSKKVTEKDCKSFCDSMIPKNYKNKNDISNKIKECPGISNSISIYMFDKNYPLFP